MHNIGITGLLHVYKAMNISLSLYSTVSIGLREGNYYWA